MNLNDLLTVEALFEALVARVRRELAAALIVEENKLRLMGAR